MKQNCVEELKKLILEVKVDLNKQDTEDGWALIHHACLKGSNEIVRLLVEEEKVNTNASTETEKWTPLTIAANSGYLDIVNTLI